MTNLIATKPNSGSQIGKGEDGNIVVNPEYQKFFDEIEDVLNENSGQIVKTGFKQFGDEIASITTQIAIDNSIPQNNEGVEVMTLAYTPRFDNSTLIIEASALASRTTSSNVFSNWSLAVFQDDIADALAAKPSAIENNVAFVQDHTDSITCKFSVPATSKTARTYKVRIGPGVAASMIFNGDEFNRVFGTLPKSWIHIQEIAA